MRAYIEGFISLFFPVSCEGCGRQLVTHEDTLCIGCQTQLPRARIHDEKDNRIERLFWGRADILSGTSFLKMPKKGVVHHLIYELKYNNNEAVGTKLGKLLGHELKASERMKNFDVIMPVPLHPKKLAMRGYNQCDSIAEGLNQVLEVELSKDNLVRVKYNNSQTKRKRYERWENVEFIFDVKNPELLKGKHVLLVDDVITTGSTIEACANALSKIEGLQLSIASLAMPVH